MQPDVALNKDTSDDAAVAKEGLTFDGGAAAWLFIQLNVTLQLHPSTSNQLIFTIYVISLYATLQSFMQAYGVHPLEVKA